MFGLVRGSRQLFCCEVCKCTLRSGTFLFSFLFSVALKLIVVVLFRKVFLYGVYPAFDFL